MCNSFPIEEIAPTPMNRFEEKVEWQPAPLLCPVPVVMVACADPAGRPNIITLAWVGVLCTEPPTVGIAVRPERFSHALLLRSGEFTVNIPTQRMVAAVDLCGVISGRDHDKWARTGLHPMSARTVGAPLIAECPLHLECRIREHSTVGSHTLFLAEITAVRVARGLIDGKGRLAIEKAGLIAYAHGHYYALGKAMGHFGFSVRKRPAGKKRARGKPKGGKERSP